MAIVIALTLVSCVAAQDQDRDQAEESTEDLNWAQVRGVVATQSTDGTWRFDVRVEHADEGWDHYADAWQVVDPDEMQVISERILTHPHDNEQPFTRSQSGIRIPDGVTSVLVRARCTVHGFGGKTVLVDLTVAEGEDYEVHAQEIDS
jgi:hypothetical protein